jgi:Tetracyclin repressor-like, C-terminal domain
VPGAVTFQVVQAQTGKVAAMANTSSLMPSARLVVIRFQRRVAVWSGWRATVLHGVMLHLVDVGEERPHGGEELPKAGACAEALLVAFDGVPLDAHHEVLGLLHPPGHLIRQAVRVPIENLAGLPVRLHEALRHGGRNGVTDVLDDHGPEAATADPLADLAAELADFQRGVSRPGRLSLVGTMLQDGTAPEARKRYQAQVIAPRRQRIRAILERAQRLGLIDVDADLEVAVTMGTGSWYARALAGDDPPPGWPARTAALVWRAAGGAIAPDPMQAG